MYNRIEFVIYLPFILIQYNLTYKIYKFIINYATTRFSVTDLIFIGMSSL